MTGLLIFTLILLAFMIAAALVISGVISAAAEINHQTISHAEEPIHSSHASHNSHHI